MRTRTCFALLLGIWVLLAATDWYVGRARAAGVSVPLVAKLAAAAFCAALAVVAWPRRSTLYRTLMSIPFSVAMLSTLLVMTAAGTFVLQGAAPEEYAHKYGGSVSRLILGLGLDDLFHTLWFQGILALLGVSLLLAGTRRAVWRPAMWGHMVSHLGVVVILVGGGIGSLFGFRGFIDIHTGQVVSAAVAMEGGVPTGERRSLGFGLRLDDFEIDRYEPEYRLYAYSKTDSGFRPVASFGVSENELAEWTPVHGAEEELRVVGIFPDFVMHSRLVATVADGTSVEGVPALEVVFDVENPDEKVHLLAGVNGRDGLRLAEDELLRFVWEPPTSDELAGRGRMRPQAHVVSFAKGARGLEQELAVEAGGEYELAAGVYRLRVLEFVPDFAYDTKLRRGYSRSDTPRNPALRVAIEVSATGDVSERWLFANMPEYDREHGGADGPRLEYRHEPAHEPVGREILVAGRSAQAFVFESGVLRSSASLADEEQRLPGLSSSRVRILESAKEEYEPGTRSGEWLEPVIELQVRDGDQVRTALLSAERPEAYWLGGGETALLFQTKPEDVKAYRSRVAVMEDGRRVREATLSVNHPLAHRGYYFYQSSYRAEDPTYSGILVVKDPGFGLVFCGFALIALGVAYIYYVRPRILRGGTV